MKRIGKYLKIVIPIGMIIFLLMKSISMNKEIEELGNIGELEGYLTVNSIGIEDIEVRKGVNPATLENAIGIYENNNDPQSYNGNICLFSHSSDEKGNYFWNLKSIKVGDLICYKTEYENREYVVYQRELLPECDTSYLEAEKEDIITLVSPIKSCTMNIVVQGYRMTDK